MHTRERAEDDANAIAIVTTTTTILIKYNRAGQEKKRKEKEGNHLCSCHRLTFNIFPLPIWYCTYSKFFSSCFSITIFFCFILKYFPIQMDLCVWVCVCTHMYVILIFIEFNIHSWHTLAYSIKGPVQGFWFQNLLNCTQ